MNNKNNNITSYILERCEQFSEKVLQIYVGNNDNLTGIEISHRVQSLATNLIEHCCAQSRVLLVLPQCAQYGAALLACWRANIVAVPTPLATQSQLMDKEVDICHIAQSADVEFILTTSALLESLSNMAEFPKAPILTIESLMKNDVSDFQYRKAHRQDLALLLYTSGSLAKPKGVMYSHDTVFQSITSPLWQMSHSSVVVSWIPQYHAFGIVCGLLAPLYHGALSVVDVPEQFVREPISWLSLMSKYKATHTGVPNFAFTHCVNSTTTESLQGLKLDSLQAIICGGDLIDFGAWKHFYEHLEATGIKPHVLAPNYGMSEAGPVTLKSLDAEPSFLNLSLDELNQGRAVVTDDRGQNARTFVSCGEVAPGTTIKIVDTINHSVCNDMEVGEIWVHSPVVTAGYFNNAQSTEQSFFASISGIENKHFLRTGDLGFIHQEQLYIVGRHKDVIILQGKNHYPGDVEISIKQICPDALNSAVFSVDGHAQPAVVIVKEVTESQPEIYLDLAKSVIEMVFSAHKLPVSQLVFVKPGSIPVTGSQKVKRQACKSLYLKGELPLLWSLDEFKSRSKRTHHASNDPAVNLIREHVLEPVLGKHALDIDEDSTLLIAGIDSIKAVRIIHLLSDVFALEINPSELYCGLSLKALAKRVEALPKPFTQKGKCQLAEYQDPKVIDWLHEFTAGQLSNTELFALIKENINEA